MPEESVLEPGRMISTEELQKEARQSLASAGATQSDAAEAVGVSRPVVNKALNIEDPSRYARVLRGIVEEYTAFVVEEKPRFQVRRKGEE
jgi:DNA-binding Lrp family transcriptional regulator